MDKNWKRQERRIAELFGTKRTPGSGAYPQLTKSDSLQEKLYIECKYRKELPKWIKSVVDDTVLKAAKEKKIPVIVFSEKGMRDDFIIIMRSDLIAVAKELKSEDA